jgi:ABC-type multidrug transport system ATPase subunit
VEIVLKNKFSEEASDIDIESGAITSLQSNDVKTIVKNLIKDYDFISVDNYNPFFLGLTVEEELGLYCKEYEKDLLMILLEVFELDDSFIERYINTLSYTEKIYLNIIRNLLLGGDKVIFVDVFKYLDYKNQKKVTLLLNYLKEKDYYIIITSYNVDYLYKISDYSIVWYKQMIDYGPTIDVYKEVGLFIKNRVPVPTLAKLTYKAKKDKDVKLYYSKDVRDIMKDIYKHA